MGALNTPSEEDRNPGLDEIGDDALAVICSFLDSTSLASCACSSNSMSTAINKDQTAWRRCFEVSEKSRNISSAEHSHAVFHSFLSPQADFCVAGTKSRLSSNDNGGSAVAYGSHSVQAKVMT